VILNRTSLSIDEIKKVQLEVLESINIFCREKKLSYFLAYGSLLGAVRHSGYIPWDDDIDIYMLRSDYNIFKQYFQDENFKLVDFERDNDYPYSYPKVYDSSTEVFEASSIHYPIGINVDIFILDNLPENIKDAREYIKKFIFIENLIAIKKLKKSPKRSFLKRIMLSVSRFLLFPISCKFLIKRHFRLSSQYSKLKAKYVADLSFPDPKKIYEKKMFENIIDLKFEHLICLAPKEYDSCLKIEFGDYMKLPSESERVSHHAFKAYHKYK